MASSLKIQRIGILTGGGDCPGLNAVIRAVAKTAMFDHKWEVLGVRDGFLGLIEDRIQPLTPNSVSGILTAGGTILGTSNKANPAKFAVGKDASGKPVFKDVTDECLKNIRKHGIDALVVIGGDGTMSCAATFVGKGVNCIGVPKTIDNDIVGTELTFGFLTAVDIATEALDRIHTTAQAHGRVMIVEVMGRNAGWIALYSGIASGSDIILIPEISYSMESIRKYIQHRAEIGRKYTIICVAEGAAPRGGEKTVAMRDPTSPDPVRLGGVGNLLAAELMKGTDLEVRCTVLGHVQRGGTPVAADRILATQFGHHAAMLLAAGKCNRLVVMRGGETQDVELMMAADKQRTVPGDHPLVRAARAVGTCFGDG